MFCYVVPRSKWLPGTRLCVYNKTTPSHHESDQFIYLYDSVCKSSQCFHTNDLIIFETNPSPVWLEACQAFDFIYNLNDAASLKSMWINRFELNTNTQKALRSTTFVSFDSDWVLCPCNLFEGTNFTADLLGGSCQLFRLGLRHF